VALGADGIIVFEPRRTARSRRCRRRSTSCPPSCGKSGKRATVMMDSGVRSGSDVVRHLCARRRGRVCRKAFLWGLGALGEEGPGHVIDLLIEETQAAAWQLGARKVEEVRSLAIRHAGALQF